MHSAAFTGVGGGSIMVPLLTGRLGLSQHRAHGSSLAIMMFAAFAGSSETGAVTFANEPDPEVLKQLYGVTALPLGVEVLYRTLREMRIRPSFERI